MVQVFSFIEYDTISRPYLYYEIQSKATVTTAHDSTKLWKRGLVVFVTVSIKKGTGAIALVFR